MRWGVGFTFSVGLAIMKGCDFGRGGVGLSRGAELSGSGVDLGYAVCLKRGWTGSRFGPEFIFSEGQRALSKSIPLKNLSPGRICLVNESITPLWEGAESANDDHMGMFGTRAGERGWKRDEIGTRIEGGRE